MAPENMDGSINLVQKQDKAKGYPHQKHPVPYQPSYKPPKRTKPCRNCGSPHKVSVRCPACGKACLYCKKLGHFAEVCQSKASRQQIHAVEGSGSAAAKSPFEDIVFESITITNLHVTYAGPKSSEDQVFVSIQVSLPQSSNRRTMLKDKIDTSAQGNILPMRLYCGMFPHQIDRDEKSNPMLCHPQMWCSLCTEVHGSTIMA